MPSARHIDFGLDAGPAQVMGHEWLLRELLSHPEAYEIVTFEDEKLAPAGFAQPARTW